MAESMRKIFFVQKYVNHNLNPDRYSDRPDRVPPRVDRCRGRPDWYLGKNLRLDRCSGKILGLDQFESKSSVTNTPKNRITIEASGSS